MGRDGGGVVRPGAGRSCELCGAPAAVHCAADAAFLCAACDAKVHGANFLASRHRRTRLVPAAAAGCRAALTSPSEEEEDGYASAASSCVSTADSASSTAAASGRRARSGSQLATRGAAAARRRAEAVLEGWAKRTGLAPVAARRRAAAAWRALRASGPDARVVPPRVGMAAALWLEVAAAAGGGACHGDALRRLEACSHVPARLVVTVATSMARARARRRSGAAADAAEEGWDECAWAGPKSSPARS